MDYLMSVILFLAKGSSTFLIGMLLAQIIFNYIFSSQKFAINFNKNKITLTKSKCLKLKDSIDIKDINLIKKVRNKYPKNIFLMIKICLVIIGILLYLCTVYSYEYLEQVRIINDTYMQLMIIKYFSFKLLAGILCGFPSTNLSQYKCIGFKKNKYIFYVTDDTKLILVSTK